ncbi:hypothetical protein [Streptomyces nitrosporeus]|uniref:hypothetical protein n=1 Tax=Streptomyces nitrosporeus TaxID=28894 RepID=UPI0039A312F6
MNPCEPHDPDGTDVYELAAPVTPSAPSPALMARAERGWAAFLDRCDEDGHHRSAETGSAETGDET